MFVDSACLVLGEADAQEALRTCDARVRCVDGVLGNLLVADLADQAGASGGV